MANRIDKLIDAWDPILQKAFLKSIYALRDQAQADLVAKMLEQGDFEGAIRAVGLDPVAFRAFDKIITDAFEDGGNFTTRGLPIVQLQDGFKVRFQFNIRNPAAERWLADHSSKLITEILDDQRMMIRGYLQDGMAAGLNPRTVALDLVGRVGKGGLREGGVIGLTSSQVEWVTSYERDLRSANPLITIDREVDGKIVKGRNLRDSRFDGAVRKAVKAGEPIPDETISKMVNTYENRALRYRAESIARTEAMTALHESQQQAMEQAVETGAISKQDVTFIWRATNDDRTRDSHAAMDGQEVGMGEMFITGDGNALEFPGDPNGDPSETINCRCAREVNVDFLAGIE